MSPFGVFPKDDIFNWFWFYYFSINFEISILTSQVYKMSLTLGPDDEELLIMGQVYVRDIAQLRKLVYIASEKLLPFNNLSI